MKKMISIGCERGLIQSETDIGALSKSENDLLFNTVYPELLAIVYMKIPRKLGEIATNTIANRLQEHNRRRKQDLVALDAVM
jgi:hypothetical protein